MQPHVFGTQNFQVGLLSGLSELMNIRVEVNCYTPAEARPGDMMDTRVSMWRASEKAMQAYKQHCARNGEEILPVTAMIITKV